MGKKTIYLVSCVKTKRKGKYQAQDLYSGNWFTKAKAYVESKNCPWFILSAKFGLLKPTKVIEPYEKTLLKMSVKERKQWAKKVKKQLKSKVSPKTRRVVVLAGSKYREFLMDYLEERFDSIRIPLERITFGNQLKWFDRKLGKKKKLNKRVADTPSMKPLF